MSAQDSSSDRRRHPRLARKFLVKFRIVAGPATPDIADQVGQVINVSKGGILLLTKRPLPPKTVLDLRFPENALGGDAKTLQGVVCRAHDETAEGDYPAGLMFVRIAPPSTPARWPQILPAAPGDRRGRTRRAQKLRVELRCVSPAGSAESESRGGVLTNLSEDGMELVTARDYAAGSEIEVRIPENPLGPSRTVRATVVWLKPAPTDGEFRVGTRIVK